MKQDTTNENSMTSNSRKKAVKRVLSKWQLYVLLLPALIILILFSYYPIYGLLIAFKDFKARDRSPWATPLFRYFNEFFSTSIATTAIKNTVVISVLSLIIGFPVPIIFALLLNQVQNKRVGRVIQTISYAPYFLSTVNIISIISMMFSTSGIVNTFLKNNGKQVIYFTSLPEWFRPLYIGSSIWQSMGFNAIIYIAALTGISPDLYEADEKLGLHNSRNLYEAAIVDGATRFQRVLHIDIPLIMPTVILMLILSVGNLLNVGYEKAFLMQNTMNTTVSELISTYVYKVGLQNAQYSFATAVGLFNSVVNFILLVIVNFFSKKFSDTSVF